MSNLMSRRAGQQAEGGLQGRQVQLAASHCSGRFWRRSACGSFSTQLPAASAALCTQQKVPGSMPSANINSWEITLPWTWTVLALAVTWATWT